MKKKRRLPGDNLTISQRRALMQVKIRADIEKSGCFIMGVFGDETRPSWTYSLGIPTTIPGTAEIMIYGLPHEDAAHIINSVVDQMREGRRFETGKQYKDVLRDFPVYFGRVEDRHYDDHFGQAQVYHNSDTSFPVLQLVWPDTQGKFPWQEGFEETFREAQPLLFSLPVGSE